MDTKMLEIRDQGTRILALGMTFPLRDTMSVAQAQITEATGFDDGYGYVLLAELAGGKGHITCSPEDWYEYHGPLSRTMAVAHEWICSHWHLLTDGSVVCVETILGERATPKVSDFAGVS